MSSEVPASYHTLADPPIPLPVTSSPCRSQDYYWDTIVLQVEDTLFRVPKYQLVGKSEIFDSMLSLPQGSNEPEGSSDDAPIKLSDISKTDFKSLLQVIYPRDAANPPELSIDSWISVLRLSSLWQMVDTRSNAISHLTQLLCNLSPADRILLGRKFSVAHWISSGYVNLAERGEVVSLEEAGKIGLSTALLIHHVRESLWKRDNEHLHRSSRSRYYGDYNNYNDDECYEKPMEISRKDSVEEAVKLAFGEELRDVEVEGDRFKD
ncbi:uncharacterized protein EV420DRAFT_308793 [Desarmillaria tabescens]|uniref:BTB domain-containing protein n=1 Tax=Armillaria tabescens TaxID=1929756 RepID=A0AA39KHX0_ARMTA|nr:uncharacterized protein EV420DRAFT_308793 [Desarmillaria tabescens]KAK0459208.1 hypothetical protein EV420DRAFT_308793 [Desarmillaria tabescens]